MAPDSRIVKKPSIPYLMNRTASMRQILQPHALYLAWLVATAATLATLYGSEVMRLPICHLCWYQRICLYPQVILLGMACYRQDHGITPYSIALSFCGLFFAAYQYAEQMIPGFAPLPLCGPSIPCNTIHLQWFGFITLPLLSLGGFLVLIGLCWMNQKVSKR